MQVQFREQTPGVKSGEWLDPATEKPASIVTIQSLDGWVAYIGDKRLGRDFPTHEAAAAFAIRTLQQRSRWRQLGQRLMTFLAPLVIISTLAFGLHSLLFNTQNEEPQTLSPDVGAIETAALELNAAGQTAIPVPVPNRQKHLSKSTSAQRPATADRFAARDTQNSKKENTITQKASQNKNASLPSVNEQEAIAKPWEQTFSELFLGKDSVGDKTGRQNSPQPQDNVVTSEAPQTEPKLVTPPKRVSIAHQAVSKPTVATVENNAKGYREYKGPEFAEPAFRPSVRSTNASIERKTTKKKPVRRFKVAKHNPTTHEDDLAADMRADRKELARLEQSDWSENSSSSASNVDEAYVETDAASETTPPSDTDPQSITTTNLSTSERATSSRYKKAKSKKRRIKKKSWRSRKAKRSRRSPLVRRIVRRNVLGQRYVVYRVRRPRNAREYRRLQRIKRRIIARQRRQYYRKYGY